MMIFGKLALGFASTIALAGAYTFREGVIRVEVDEHSASGAHVHVWAPAALVPMAMHFAPREELRRAANESREFLPTAEVLVKELKKYPDAVFVDVQDGGDHVRVATAGGKLKIDVTQPGETVHVLCPLSTVSDVLSQLGENRSTI